VASATFFEHQALARRNTKVMVLLFLAAVAAVVVAVDLVLALVWLYGQEFVGQTNPDLRDQLRQVPGGIYVVGALVTAGIIFIVSAVNVTRLAGGGAAVAKMVGARRVATDTADPLEKRLRNVVEEMAIASGVRVPDIYIMDGEQGINAFAAGWDVSNAVVAVTRGTLETLTRDELQGVIAHEFSHILHGDMRLNIRMIGVLAGIVFIGSIGSFVMRHVRGGSDNKGAVPVLLIGLALFIIGYVGVFFARLIKSAVSRQREFLADASSVQFTRNPDGIAGALDQIRSSQAGTLIANRYAEETSHMFFGGAVRVWLGGLFDTHPPVDERIRRVHPGFQPSPYRKRRSSPPPAAMTPEPAGAAAFATAVPSAGRRVVDVGARWGRTPDESAALVGSLDAGKVDYAARLLGSLSEPLREALHEPSGAGAVMVALLLAPNEQAMALQLDALKKAGLGELGGLAAAARVHTRNLGLPYHLPVIDLGLAALKSLPDAGRQQVVSALEAAVQADRRVSLHEFVVLALVRDQLVPEHKVIHANKKLADLRAEAATLLALVCYAGTRSDVVGDRQKAVQAAQAAGAKLLGLAADTPAVPKLDAARGALQALKALAPMQKAILVKGLFAAVTVDGTIRVGEAGLMRLVGAVLDCPLPPLLAEIDPATLAA
jgi:Zn-dependent protease with chaperone function